MHADDTCRLGRVLALMDDSARFYVCRAFEPAPGELLKPSWALGFFLTVSKPRARVGLASPWVLAGVAAVAAVAVALHRRSLRW